MTKECCIKPITITVSEFRNLNVLLYNVQPFLYDIFS